MAPFTRLAKYQKHLPKWCQELLRRCEIYAQDARRADLTKQASAMAYVTLFSLVPSLAAIFTLLGLFLPFLGDHSHLMGEARQFLFKYLATGSGTTVVDYLEKFIATLDLKKIGMSAFIGLLVTLIILLRQIEEALNRIWMVSQARPMMTRFIYFWLFLTLGMFSASVVIGLSTSYSITTFITRQTLAVADKADDIPVLAMFLNWLFTCLLFFLAYKVIPNCEVRNKAARGGAILAGTLFYVLSKIYTIYVTSFASYNNIYGTLAALPIFLMWIYVCWMILLAGALLAWRWQSGWPKLSEEHTLEVTLSHLDEHRNRAIKSFLPSLVLIAIYECFREGRPLDMTTLVEQLKLPYSWVFEAVELLRELGLTVTAKVAKLGESERDQILPVQGPEMITHEHLSKITEEPILDWLKNWEPTSFKAVTKFVENVKTHGSPAIKTIEQATISAIIGK